MELERRSTSNSIETRPYGSAPDVVKLRGNGGQVRSLAAACACAARC
jgi:hypothetical protein